MYLWLKYRYIQLQIHCIAAPLPSKDSGGALPAICLRVFEISKNPEMLLFFWIIWSLFYRVAFFLRKLIVLMSINELIQSARTSLGKPERKKKSCELKKK